jgi:hypothetical protein
MSSSSSSSSGAAPAFDAAAVARATSARTAAAETICVGRLSSAEGASDGANKSGAAGGFAPEGGGRGGAGRPGAGGGTARPAAEGGGAGGGTGFGARRPVGAQGALSPGYGHGLVELIGAERVTEHRARVVVVVLEVVGGAHHDTRGHLGLHARGLAVVRRVLVVDRGQILHARVGVPLLQLGAERQHLARARLRIAGEEVVDDALQVVVAHVEHRERRRGARQDALLQLVVVRARKPGASP